MYRCVSMHPEDHCVQSILWREDVVSELEVYELNTVTYGTAQTSFLAIMYLKKLADAAPNESTSKPSDLI